MNEHPHGALENPEVAHEESDISIRGVIWFVVVLVITAAVIQVAMAMLFKVYDKIEVRNDPYVTPLAPAAGQLPPEPQLQRTPWEDLKQFRASEQEYLHSYGWVDQATGVAHVPIDKAKEMLLQRGLPAREPSAGAAPDSIEGTHFAAFGQSNSGRSIPAGMPDRSTPQVAPPPPPAAPQTPGGSAPAPTTPAAPGKPGGGR